MDGFYYVPMHANVTSADMKRHVQLAMFFEPANWIDRTLFRGPLPGSIPMGL